MTDDGMNRSGSSGQPQFLVQHGGKVYRTTGVEEVDPQDQQVQAMLGGQAESVSAFVQPATAGMSFKSAAMSTGSPQEAANFGNIGNENEATNFGNIGNE